MLALNEIILPSFVWQFLVRFYFISFKMSNICLVRLFCLFTINALLLWLVLFLIKCDQNSTFTNNYYQLTYKNGDSDASEKLKIWSQSFIKSYHEQKYHDNQSNSAISNKNSTQDTNINIESILNDIYSDQYGKCVQKANNLSVTFQWTIKPEPCSEKDSLVMLIKSSIFRNALRWQVRKTWAKEASWSK